MIAPCVEQHNRVPLTPPVEGQQIVACSWLHWLGNQSAGDNNQTYSVDHCTVSSQSLVYTNEALYGL